MASGEEALAMPIEEFAEVVGAEGQLVSVLALKRYLRPLCGQSRFKQRLLDSDGQMLSDDAVLAGPMDLQLILCCFEPSSDAQIRQLLEAAKENNFALMERLLQRPQDPDLECEIEPSPPALHVACFYGCIEAARFLLEEADADKDTADKHGSTPIYLAATKGHVKMVQLLLEAKADKDKANGHGATPILKASLAGHSEVVRVLLEANADIHRAATNGKTPMLAASQKGHLEVVRLLLAAHADIDKATNSGMAPLHMASAEGHLEVIRVLLEANADMDGTTNQGATPMYLAVAKGHPEAVLLLLGARLPTATQSPRSEPQSEAI